MTARTRLQDIAAHAGVSTATASRVLNGKEGVSAATRTAILTAMDELGYERPATISRPNRGVVGLVVPELANPIFPAFAQAAVSQFGFHGYATILATQSAGGATEDEIVATLLEHGVDGLCLVSGLHADLQASTARYDRLAARRLPFVTINGPNPAVDAPSFATDDRAAMELAVRHLAAQGHRRVGLTVGPERFVPAARKIEGFRAACAQHLSDPDPPVEVSLYSVEAGGATLPTLLEAGCTGVVCGSDLMALGVIHAARARGLRVPEDLSVIGFDDSPLVAFTDPPLTTLRQPVAHIVQAATSTLLAMLTGTTVARHEMTFTPELVVRGSTGAAPNGKY